MARAPLTALELKQAKKAVQALLENVTMEVAGLPKPVLREVLPALQAAEAEVAADFAKWMKAGKGSATFTAQQYRSLLVQLRTASVGTGARLAKVPGWVGKVNQELRSSLNKGSHTAGALATRHVMRELEHLNLVFTGTAAPLPLSTVAIIAKGDKALVPRFASSAAKYSGGMWEDIKRQLSIGVARNETFDQLGTRLQKLGGPKAEGAAQGLFTRHRYQADRLVRTEMTHAYNVQHEIGILEVHALDSGIKKRWDASLDKRICSVCSPLHGAIVGVHENFPGGYDKPPAHPNCRCAIIAWHESWGADPTGKTTKDPQRQQEKR